MASDTGSTMPPEQEQQPVPMWSSGRGRHHGPPWARGRWRADEDAPPWWPVDLAWPPDEYAWEANRRRVLRKFLVGLAIFGFIVATMVSFAIAAITGSWDNAGPLRGLMIFFLLAVIFGIIRITRSARGFMTFADVMQAADRVATGDYAVRVNERGSPDTRQLALSFNTMVERLAENDSQRRAFFADIAHELRTPLSVVRGTIEAMLDGVYPADSEHLSPLLDEITVITRLLEDLQLVATAEAGGLKLYREQVDLGELDDDLIAAFSQRAAAASITLRAEIPSGIDIDLDPVRIRQVLENLVSNAIRYTPDGGSVIVSGQETSSGVEVSVIDTGAGMTDEQREKMFDRFVKSADSGGSGLGLSIAKSLIEAHGGRIWATPTEGGGTTVSFSIPRHN
jgi:signal transduction histidine kinase